MEAAAVWISSVAAGLSILVALAVTLAWRSSVRRTSAEIEALQATVHGFETALRASSPNARAAFQGSPISDSRTIPMVAEFLITDAGTEHPQPAEEVSSRLVLSATVGEPLVKMAALAHGLRRALAPENRNRIRFEMRREIRRARKARRAAGRAAAADARSQAVRP